LDYCNPDRHRLSRLGAIQSKLLLKKTPFRAESIGMKAEQFIEFANDFAKASARSSSNEIQQAYEDNLDCLARPGDQVVVIRKPWPIGHWGKVIAFREFNPCYFRVEVEIDGKRLQIPAHALARRVGAQDCEKAELQYIYLLMKINGLTIAKSQRPLLQTRHFIR
jgi:hypothetical protein